MLKSTIFNFLKKDRAPSNTVDYSEQIVKWGIYNNKPFEIIQLIRRSGTAARCADTRAKYLYGKGFANKEIGNIMVNETQTANDLLLEFTNQLTKLWGYSANIKYNGIGQIAKIYPIGFEDVRLGKPDEEGIIKKAKTNPYWGLGEFRNSDTVEYDLFNTELSAIKEQYNKAKDEWNGQIFYKARTSEYSRFYPSPSWYADFEERGSGKSAMESEYLLSALLSKEIGSGFLQNVVMKMIGDPEAPIPEHQHLKDSGKKYTTMQEQFQEDLNQNFAGIDGNSMLILWSQMKEEFPELEAFPSQFNYDKLKDVRESIKRDIAEYWDVPPILVGIQSSGAISKDDMQSASLYMHSSVRLEQQMIEADFLKLLKGMGYDVDYQDVKIANFNPYPETNGVENYVWNELSTVERRRWIAANTDIELDEEIEEEVVKSNDEPNNNSLLTNLTGRQMQNIQRIVRRYVKGDLTKEQAGLLLKDGYNFTDEQVDMWLVENNEEDILEDTQD